MHSAGLELTKLTYTGLDENLIRHRGDRLFSYESIIVCSIPIAVIGNSFTFFFFFFFSPADGEK